MIKHSHQKVDTTHNVVTGGLAAYSGLPGRAFLIFLDGEAWVITLQATDQQTKRKKEKEQTIQSCHSLRKQNVYDHPGHLNLRTNDARTQMGYAKKT